MFCSDLPVGHPSVFGGASATPSGPQNPNSYDLGSKASKKPTAKVDQDRAIQPSDDPYNYPEEYSHLDQGSTGYWDSDDSNDSNDICYICSNAFWHKHYYTPTGDYWCVCYSHLYYGTRGHEEVA